MHSRCLSYNPEDDKDINNKLGYVVGAAMQP